MGILGILLLVGGALAGMVGLGGLDVPELDEEQLKGAAKDAEDPDDVVVGTDGVDALLGGDGDDWMIGLDGADTLDGQTGGEVLIAGAGADVISGGAGNDFVEAANVIDETALRQSLVGADDIFDVAFQYDLPHASDEGDVVNLGDGDDTVVAGSDDTVSGGDGADEFALGDWIEGGQPVEITDFDEAEDIITFVYDKEGDAPEMSVEVNETTGVTTIKADGQPIAVLRDTSPAFSTRNIAVGRYVA